tara:strand:- start:777 stop:1103 length:327 start_codon:yes stop_codon:yes gene_type:complete
MNIPSHHLQQIDVLFQRYLDVDTASEPNSHHLFNRKDIQDCYVNLKSPNQPDVYEHLSSAEMVKKLKQQQQQLMFNEKMIKHLIDRHSHDSKVIMKLLWNFEKIKNQM